MLQHPDFASITVYSFFRGGGIFVLQNLQGIISFLRLGLTICSRPHCGHFRFNRSMVNNDARYGSITASQS